ncbi:MAG: protein-disulfide reductase DsbD, partial [bacterium]|nr:protein-disulfide reductase DsbD [bacterium]
NEFFNVTTRDTLGLKFGQWQYPPTVKYKEQDVYQGKVVVKATVTIASNASLSTASIPITVGYQICAEFGAETCFMPTERTVNWKAKRGTAVPNASEPEVTPVPTATDTVTTTPVTPATTPVISTPATTVTTPPANESLEDKFSRALQEGSWFAFILVFLGGVFASLTPCVYPVIPITMGYIGSRAGGNKVRGFTLSLAFVLGLAIVYSTLGLVAASTGALFGAFTQTPWFLGAIALVFGVMGISMLGVFDLPIPGFAAQAQGNPKGGYFGAAVMGGLSGLVAAPCVGPILVALLAWVAQSGSLLLGFFLLFTFSMGMGLLFIAIGTFSGLLQSLPQAGEWMVAIKKFFGFALLAGALYVLKPFIPDGINLFVWAILLSFGGMTLWGKPLTPEDEMTLGFGFQRGMAILLVAASLLTLQRMFSVGMGWELVTVHNTVASTTGGEGAGVSELPWMKNDEAGALAKAKTENKPILIDFYADWCAACVELDHYTWPDPTVQKAAAGFIALKFDFTKQNDATKALMQKYKIQGLPTVLLLSPDGTEKARFTGFKPPAETVQWMSSVTF